MVSPTIHSTILPESQRVGALLTDSSSSATIHARRGLKRPLFTIAPALLGIAVAIHSGAHAATVSQNSLITQTNPNYIYFEGEWFDRVTAPDPNPLWTVNFSPPAGSSGGKTLIAPSANDTAGANNDFAIFRFQFSGATAPGDYSFYAFRTGGAGDSVFAPPSFNADPFQSPEFPNTGNAVNRWNTIVDNSWNQLGVNGDFPGTGYFATNAYTYRVAPGDLTTVVEFRLEAREAFAQFDRFALHKTSNLTGAQLDALTFSNVTIGNPVQPPPPPPFLNIGPAGGAGVFGIREVRNNGTLNSTTDAANSLLSNNTNPAAGTRFEGTSATIAFNDPEAPGGGFFATNRAPFFSNTAADDDDFALIANGFIRIPVEGDYTFGFNSDDGARLKIQGATFTSSTGGGFNGDTLEFPTPTGASNTLGVTHLTAGDYRTEFIFFERAGGAFAELYAAPGVFTAFDAASFDLVGDTANGGLAVVVPEPSAGLMALSGAIALLGVARRRRVS